MLTPEDSSPSQGASSNFPYDPQGEVLTTDHLEKSVMEDGRPMLNNYIRHSKIGGGQHGEVYLCYQINARHPQGHPDRQLAVAIKSVKRDNPRAEQFKRLRQQRLPTSSHTPLADRLNTTEAKIRKEIAIMKKCRHPHVVRLYEVIDDRLRDKIYMVMEYLEGGEVKWRQDNEPILKVEQSKRIIRDAVLGLEYLHHQGIIHRDIKPANLLWTKDRGHVKIADFGVSHFSYAQRLAAAGKDGVSSNNPEDPILLDDSDLTRRAGTPSFLAPEIIYEHTHEVELVSPASSSNSHDRTSTEIISSPTRKRPQITKAIDVWALGVTLYCLLFGKTPFIVDSVTPASEWSLYNSICNNDWTADDTMGSDQIPTGGRHPVAENTEGALVLHLLDHFLEKDVKLRITLEEVKESPWFLRDLPEPDKWLKLTSMKPIDVSVDEASDAMSTVFFRWNWGAVITRRISSLFRRSRDDNDDDRDARGPVRSAPQVRTRRPKTSGAGSTSYQPDDSSKRDKGKQRAARPPSTTSRAPKSSRSKSTEPRPIQRRAHGTASLSALHAPRRSGRRGSTADTNPNPSSQPSPTSSDKPRTRFGFLLNSIGHWRPNKYTSQGTSTTNTTTPSSLTDGSISKRVDSGVQTTRSKVTRRSEEALRYRRYNPLDEGGALTADRRASSWGQGDQPAEFSEVLNFQSIRHERSERELRSAAYNGLHSDQSSFAPRTPSGLSNVAASSPSKEPLFGEVQRHGPAYFDEDSSTIASACGGDANWQNGSEDESDEDENAVTFQPRRR